MSLDLLSSVLLPPPRPTAGLAAYSGLMSLLAFIAVLTRSCNSPAGKFTPIHALSLLRVRLAFEQAPERLEPATRIAR